MTDEQAGASRSEEVQGTALHLMASRHRVAAAQQKAQFTAALRVAFGRMAAECPGLDATVQQVDIAQTGLAEILDLVETGMFLALLEGREDVIGMIMACPVLLAGMIEAQTTGQISTDIPPPRKPTRTDAALMAPMIDAFLRLVDQRCADLPEAGLVTGYVYGSYLDDPRPLGILLDDRRYLVLKFDVSLGFGAKQGQWCLILPEISADPSASTNTPNDVDAQRDWQDRLETAVAGSEVVISAILARVHLTLTQALRLRPGDIVTLPDSVLETLSVETISGGRLGVGRLGQARGQRALRLTADPGEFKDALGGPVPLVPLPASIRPFTPPKAVFVPEDSASDPAVDHIKTETHRQEAARPDPE